MSLRKVKGIEPHVAVSMPCKEEDAGRRAPVKDDDTAGRGNPAPAAHVFDSLDLKHSSPGGKALPTRAQAVESMCDAYLLTGPDGCFLDANAAALRYFPCLRTLPHGAALSQADGLPELLVNCREGIHSFDASSGDETLHLRVSCTYLMSCGQMEGRCHIITDDTDSHQLLRGTFFLYATRDFDLCRRKKENASLLMLDVDMFKDVNDVHGHVCGDAVLIGISKTICTRLRHTDLCGRYGGEEIVIWLPGATAEGAVMIADIVRRAVESLQFDGSKGTFHVTVSIGVASVDFARHGSLDALVSEADNALYQAKRGGRNRVCVYSP